MGKAVKKGKGNKMLAEAKYVAWRLGEMRISLKVPFLIIIFSFITFLVGCWFASLMNGFIKSGVMTIYGKGNSGGTIIHYAESPIQFIIYIGVGVFGSLLMFGASMLLLSIVFKYWNWRKTTTV